MMRCFKQVGGNSAIALIVSCDIAGLKKDSSFEGQAEYKGITVRVPSGPCFAFFRPENGQCAGRQGEHVPAAESNDFCPGVSQLPQERKEIRMDILCLRSLRKIKPANRDPVVDH